MNLQEDIDRLLAPSNQLYDGPVFDPSPISAELAITGQVNPIVARTQATEHGQFLSGLGDPDPMHEPDVVENVIERAEHAEVYDLEQQDDVLGSGIFDPYHRPGTSNTNTGVFASHNSLPGYVAREVPFTVSNEVTDLTDDASIVVVPGGGMAYVEADGRLKGPAAHGMPPPHPNLRPHAPTSQLQPYVDLTPQAPRGWDVDSLLSRAEAPGAPTHLPAPGGMLLPNGAVLPPAGAPIQQKPVGPSPLPNGAYTPQPMLAQSGNGNAGTAPPSAAGMPAPQGHGAPIAAPSLGVPTVPGADPRTGRASQPRMPRNTPAFPGYPGSPFNYPFPPGHPPRQPFFQVEQVPGYPAYSRVPGYPPQMNVAQRSSVYPQGARIAVGQAEPGNSTATTLIGYGLAGLAVGAALKMVFGKK